MHGHLVKGSFWDGLKDLGSNWRQLISFLFRLEVLKCGQCEAHLGQSPGFGGKGRRLQAVEERRMDREQRAHHLGLMLGRAILRRGDIYMQ